MRIAVVSAFSDAVRARCCDCSTKRGETKEEDGKYGAMVVVASTHAVATTFKLLAITAATPCTGPADAEPILVFSTSSWHLTEFQCY